MITFDNFYALDSKTRKAYVNDIEVLKQMVKQNVSEHRFEHSLSVADTCKSLALKHRVDSNKAYVAGLLHDCCKFSNDKNFILEEYLKYYDPEKLNGAVGIYHSWVAKYYLKEKLNFHDKDILNAIYNHTICNSNDKLSIILYIADKREPLRNIDDGILDIAYVDLFKAKKLLDDDVKKYIEGKNERFVETSI